MAKCNTVVPSSLALSHGMDHVQIHHHTYLDLDFERDLRSIDGEPSRASLGGEGLRELALPAEPRSSLSLDLETLLWRERERLRFLRSLKRMESKNYIKFGDYSEVSVQQTDAIFTTKNCKLAWIWKLWSVSSAINI